MATKSCRHVGQAVRAPEFKRALRHHDALGCELCAAPPVRGNHRSKPSRRRTATSPVTPDTHGASSPCDASSSIGLTAAQTLKGWTPNPGWEDLCICVTCGYMACRGKNHLMQHFQIHPKHYVGFDVASRTFWCCSCKHEVDSSKSKIQDQLRECDVIFEEIATKQQRRVRSRLVTNPTLSPEDDEVFDSQRSYVADDESRRGGIADELLAAISTDCASDTASSSSSQPSSMRSRSQSPDESKAPTTRTLTPPPPTTAIPPTPPTNPTAPSVLGFSNLGNTCYFNAATQALLTVLYCFSSFVHQDEIINRISTSPIAATLMMLQQTIVKKTAYLPPPSISITKPDGKKSKTKTPTAPVLTVAPLLKEMRKKFAQFRGSYQQDAHELFTSLLWAIDEEIDPPKPQPKPVSSGKPTDELVNVFVKTDTGETISLRVKSDATVDEIQAMLAKKLALDDSDVYLAPTAAPRPTITRRSTMARGSGADDVPVFSKLNFVRALFSGALTTEVRCRACGHRSETMEDAFQLSLPMPAVANGRTLSVHDCLTHFTAETVLSVDAENGYDCDKCSRPPPTNTNTNTNKNQPPTLQLRDASMRQCISELPRVLVLHLKRLGRLRKVTQHIQFDAMLDMAPHVDNDVLDRSASTLYELVGVVVHKGNKRAGHYVAYVSRRRELASAPSDANRMDASQTTRSTLWTLEDPDHDWFYVSDSLVQPVAFEQVLQCEAYMLFYQQVAPSESPRFTTVSSVRETDDLDDSDRESGVWL